MKTLITTAMIIAALGLTACNESTHEDAQDVRASKGAIAKDSAAVDKYQDKLAADRAAKARAKASGDRVTQAKKSVAIGADKAVIEHKKTERKVDERILEEDQKDLRN